MKRTGRIVLGMLLAIGLFLADQPQSRAEATGNPRPAVVSPQSLLLVVGLDEASLAMRLKTRPAPRGHGASPVKAIARK